jgi:hypothetical protein
MYQLLRLVQDALNRGEALSPFDCLVALACLTLVTYAVLLISGRGRLI